MKDKKNNKHASLEDMHKKLMSRSTPTLNPSFSQWEKTGEMYKQFSLYDTSKYESTASSNIITNK